MAEIPVVGEPLHKAWSLSATNLESALETYAPQVKAFVSSGLSAVGSLGGSVVQFIISILISGVVMSNAGRCKAMANKVVSRLLGDKGEEYVGLSIATVRSVVQGVIGVAVIQAVLAGLGMGVAGVPATGLWMLSGIDSGDYPTTTHFGSRSGDGIPVRSRDNNSCGTIYSVGYSGKCE